MQIKQHTTIYPPSPTRYQNTKDPTPRLSVYEWTGTMWHFYKEEWSSSLFADVKLFIRYIIEWKMKSTDQCAHDILLHCFTKQKGMLCFKCINYFQNYTPTP
jgi:hypothetical protein